MFQKIKKLADDAIALQNKLGMEAALRQISELIEKGHNTESKASGQIVGKTAAAPVNANDVMDKISGESSGRSLSVDLTGVHAGQSIQVDIVKKGGK